MRKKTNTHILAYEHEPFCILEGGTGLNDTERRFLEMCQKRSLKVYEIDNLYEDATQLLAIRYLKPKTIVFGTTGVYNRDLTHCIEIFKIAEYWPDTVLISIGEELESIRKLLKEAKSNNPNFKAYGLYPISRFAEESEQPKLFEIYLE